jgi:hypothetical protein
MIVSKQIGQLNGLNKFLERIYGTPVTLSSLLVQWGLTINEIETIKNNYLSEYIQFLVENHIAKQTISGVQNRKQDVIVHYYGLLTGIEKSLEDIGKIYYVSSTRIRQLLNSRYKDFPVGDWKWKQIFEESLYKLAKQYL